MNSPINPRRTFSFTLEEGMQVRKLANKRGVSTSALIRGWIEEFLKSGSPRKSEPERGIDRIQVIIDLEVAGRADAKAMGENHVELIDIIRHRLSEEVEK